MVTEFTLSAELGPLLCRRASAICPRPLPRNASAACDSSPRLRGRRAAPDAARRAPGTCTATSWPRAISVDRAAARQQRDAEPHLHRALDAVEARQRDQHVERRVLLLEHAQHALARRRRIVVRDHRSRAPTSSIVTCARVRQRMRRRHEQDELVAARAASTQPALGRLERQHAEVEAALQHFDARSAAPARGARRRAICGCALRKRSMSGSSVCTAASLAPMSTRPRRRSRSSRTAGLGFVGEPQQPLRVVLQHRPASVSVPSLDERSNSRSPSSSSSRRTAWLTAGCVRCSLWRPREKLRSVRNGEKRRSGPAAA